MFNCHYCGQRHPKGDVDGNCPNCGAPIDLDEYLFFVGTLYGVEIFTKQKDAVKMWYIANTALSDGFVQNKAFEEIT